MQSATRSARQRPGTTVLPRSARQADREIIYLVAPAGHPNYGDEFILRAWLHHLSRVRPHADVIVDCHTPGQAAVLFRSAHPNITFVDTAWRVCWETAHLPAADALELAGRIVSDPGVMPAIVSGIELLAQANTVHLVGGGYLNTVWPHHLALLAIAIAAANRSGGRLVATGQGLAPWGNADRLSLLRGMQARFEVFDVRDASSYQALAGHGTSLSVTGDDAWLGIGEDGVYDAETVAASRSFVFCLQSDLMEDFAFAGRRGVEGLAQAAATLIDKWHIDGNQAVFLECIPRADRLVFDRIAHLLPGAVFVPFTDLWWGGLPARTGQTWVSTRFHMHLLAAAAGACGIALSGRSDYYPTKHRSLIDSGSRWRHLEPSLLPEEPVHSGGFASDGVARFRARKNDLAMSIYPTASVTSTRSGRQLMRIRGR